MEIHDDMLMWKNGQMLILEGNRMVLLREDIILMDGTRIAADGRVIMTDGTFQQLVEGQAILVEGPPPPLSGHLPQIRHSQSE